MRIGRGPDVELNLRGDPQVSRAHAALHSSEDALEASVIDSSTNGTFLNGVRVTSATARDGDILRVGDTLLLFRLLREVDAVGPSIPGLCGQGPGMGELRRTIARVAPTDATVLIIGETGTGKELVARATYTLSGCVGPFVAVNCAAIPGTLAESQLFGHVAGAFTGASREHEGYVRAAHGGVLFLDEIGELALELQGKLLRFLDERAATPVGSTRSIRSEARVVAATNRDLREEVQEKRFRGDLYARLAEITIYTLPLRHRAEDILPTLLQALSMDASRLTPELAEAIVLYDWPFNVRELLKVGKELTIRGDAGQVLGHELVANRLSRRFERSPESPVPAPTVPSHVDVPIPDRAQLESLLRRHKGVLADVARATGRSRRQVQRWIESHCVDLAAFRGRGPSRHH
jgi:transcriptional regulator with PAS, ATPase and Fis domain